VSYGLTVDLLAEILPLGEELAKTSVRRQVQRVAERAESELGDEQFSFIEGCQRDWNELLRPDPPLTVGLDGGYVHACHTPVPDRGLVRGDRRQEPAGRGPGEVLRVCEHL
jgi:hypothetical protein